MDLRDSDAGIPVVPFAVGEKSSNQTKIERHLDFCRQQSSNRTRSAEPYSAAAAQLPLWNEVERAIPNHLARSSLFAPVERGARRHHEGTELPSRSDVRLRYWGMQLDEPDCDVWMQALHLARSTPLGHPVKITRAKFLRAIGRQTSNSAYTWLHGAFERLWQGGISVESKKYSIGPTRKGSYLRLINSFEHNPMTDSYEFLIDQRMVLLFGNQEFALVDWEKRLQIQVKKDMAKYLQRLSATSSDAVQRYALADLRERMLYESPIRKFRIALCAAMNELERLEIIGGARIEFSSRGHEQAVWHRVAHRRRSSRSGL